MVRPAAILATVSICLGGAAQAKETIDPGVAVLDVRAVSPADAAEAAALRDALAIALSHYRVSVPEADPAVRAAHSEGRDSALLAGIELAKSRLKEGRALYDSQDPVAAEAKFREAVNLFESNAAGLSTNEDLVGTYLYLARIFFATQREVQVREIFRRVVQLSPDLILDRAIYPGGMIKVYEEVKGEILGSPQGSLKVESKPSPARVFLDGKERGITPLSIVNIPPGVHELDVKRPGFAAFARPVDVTSFRVDTIAAELLPDRYSDLAVVFAPRGTEIKDAFGLTVGDYVAAVAASARLDLAIVGQLARKGGGFDVTLRVFDAPRKIWSAPRNFHLAEIPDSFDAGAGQVLLDAANAGWIPALGARRNVASGGGALDSTAPLGFRAAFVPGFRVAGTGRHFPNAPSAGFRVGIDRRLRPRLSVSLETGFDGLYQNRMPLSDSSGAAIATPSDGVTGVYTAIPLTAGARYYVGVSTWAPFIGAGAGVRWDSVTWRESLAFDRLSGASGFGYEAFVGGGAERALSARSAIYFETRVLSGKVGVKSATLHTSNYPDRSVPVDAGSYTTMRAYLGYLRIF